MCRAAVRATETTPVRIERILVGLSSAGGTIGPAAVRSSGAGCM